MICYIVLSKNSIPRETRPAPRKKKKGIPLADLGFLAVAAAAVPASGFITGDSGVVEPTVGAVHRTPMGAGMRTFLSACAWAFMLAAGSMIYQHFLSKWEKSGLPILPIAALGVMTGNPAMPNQASGPAAPRGFPPQQQQPSTPPGYGIPLGSPPPHYQSQPQQGAQQQRSVIDRYPC